MITKFKKLIVITLCSLFSTFGLAWQEKPHDNVLIDSIEHTDFYKNVAISEIQTEKNGEFVSLKININAMELKTRDENAELLSTPTPTLGKLIWAITADQLPVTERQCHRATMDLCEDLPLRKTCFKPCLKNGPEVVLFDENANKLYFAISTTAAGETGKGPYFIFVADLNKKEIKPLLMEPISRPVENYLSPKGNYLLTRGYRSNYITLIDLKKRTSTDIDAEEILQHKDRWLHYPGKMKWLSETQFSYQDGLTNEEWHGSFDEMKEYIYDIPAKKIIRSRTMDKSEYEKV